MEIFGYEIKRKTSDKQKEFKSFVDDDKADGAISVINGGFYNQFNQPSYDIRDEMSLIEKYRAAMLQPEVSNAVEDIINEAINITETQVPVTIVTDDIKQPDKIKKKIRDEFAIVLKMLDFSNQGYEIFQRWYVDGRIYFHAIVDEENPSKGIQELKYIDPRKIKKIREYDKVTIDPKINYQINVLKEEYYLYTDSYYQSYHMSSFLPTIQGLKISPDVIVESNSGILNADNTMVLSNLHKALKALNQLRMMEDASVIYRLARAPERRVFYIDVGNLPNSKAEQYLRSMMANFKKKIIYDQSTGEIKDDQKFMQTTDDFWLPRREGGRGTQIETLPAGQNLGEMEDIEYFKKRLYKALNVPISRIESEGTFNFGRANEITRDEIKFAKFVRRLRVRFSILFDAILEKQLVLKNIIKPEEWSEIQDNLRYDFQFDNHFEELKNYEILRERLQVADSLANYMGTFYSKNWIRRNILQQNDDEIKEMDKEIEEEKTSEPDESEEDNNSNNFT